MVKHNWTIEYVDYNYNAWEEGEKIWKKCWDLRTPELYMELREPCNCFTEYGWVMHVNGGNYHYIVKFYTLDDEYMLCVWSNTREAFSPYEQGFIVVRNEKQELAVWSETIQDCKAEVMRREEALEYINALIDKGYYAVE
jgi:hypothetical protein